MNTKHKILETAHHLLSANGLNAFSYKDISHQIGIKTSSIHYYYPTKTDLILALINEASLKRKEVMRQWRVNTSIEQLDAFMDFYIQLAKEKNMCLIMSISSDIHEMDDRIKTELYSFYNFLVEWLVSVLKEGLNRGHLQYKGTPELKADEILSTAAMMPILSRIGKDIKEIVDAKVSLLQKLTPVN